jgi:hypothetical protein
MAPKLAKKQRVMLVSTNGQESTLSVVISVFQENDYLKINKRRETWDYWVSGFRP